MEGLDFYIASLDSSEGKEISFVNIVDFFRPKGRAGLPVQLIFSHPLVNNGKRRLES